jgi:CheY-like chemotaxis protein
LGSVEQAEAYSTVSLNDVNPHRTSEPLPIIILSEADDVTAIKEFLKGRGWRVLRAESCEETIDLALSNQPCLIMIEIKMPLVDGFTTTRRIRQQTELKSTAVVAICRHRQPQYREAAIAAGCTDYMCQPFEVEKLESIIEHLLGQRSRGQEA